METDEYGNKDEGKKYEFGNKQPTDKIKYIYGNHAET